MGPPMKTTTPAMSARVYHDLISRRAREIWRARHHPTGKDMDIWIEAERELVVKGVIPPSPPATEHQPRDRMAADEIDEVKMLRRLNDFGEVEARSVTALG